MNLLPSVEAYCHERLRQLNARHHLKDPLTDSERELKAVIEFIRGLQAQMPIFDAIARGDTKLPEIQNKPKTHD